MGAPALFQFQQGQGSVSADNLNTFEQTCDTAADLRGFVGTQGMQVYMRGFSAPGDGGQGPFYWNIGGVAPDDNGVTTVVPYGSVPGSGVWTRLAVLLPAAFNFQAMLSGNQQITSNQTVVFDQAIQNIGGMYNPFNGVVTVPVSGLYFFATTCGFEGTAAVSNSTWTVGFNNIGPLVTAPLHNAIALSRQIASISFSGLYQLSAGSSTFVGVNIGTMTTLYVSTDTGLGSMFFGAKIG